MCIRVLDRFIVIVIVVVHAHRRFFVFLVVVHRVYSGRVFRVRAALVVLVAFVGTRLVALLAGLGLVVVVLFVGTATCVFVIPSHQRVEHPRRFVPHARHRSGVVLPVFQRSHTRQRRVCTHRVRRRGRNGVGSRLDRRASSGPPAVGGASWSRGLCTTSTCRARTSVRRITGNSTRTLCILFFLFLLKQVSRLGQGFHGSQHRAHQISGVIIVEIHAVKRGGQRGQQPRVLHALL